VTAAREDVQAVAKIVRCSARKARLVADHIRGRSVPEARSILAFTPRAAAREVEKVLKSAVANAETTRQWNGDELYVSAVFVDEGPTLKRWRARARGRVTAIKKRTCHITLKVDQYEVVPAAPRRAPKVEAAPKQASGESKAKKTSKKKKAVAS
jgi:large subunit ribosomal protein L22